MRSSSRGGLRARLGRMWSFGTTLEGKLVAGGIVFSGSVAVASLEIAVFVLLCGLCGLAVVTWTFGRLFRPRVTLAGNFPDKGVAGQPVRGEFILGNPSRRAIFDVSVGLFGLPRSLRLVPPERVVTRLDPGDEAPVPVTVLPRRRGAYELPGPCAYSVFPMGLHRTRARVMSAAPDHSSRLLVLPHFHPVSHLDVPVSERYQPGGIALSSHVGESPEYIGNREYRPGDALKHLDHRSWARHARPVVREFQEEYYCRIALVLDTYVPGRRPPGPEGFPDLEAAVGLSASVADALSRGEYIIDLFAAGPELYVFRAGRHTAHFENVLEILACVDACRSNPFEVVTPALADELAHISTVVAVLLDWDASRAALVRAAVEAGCRVKVLIVRDGPTSIPLHDTEGVYAMTQLSVADIRDGTIEAL